MLKVRRKADKNEKFFPYDFLRSYNLLEHLSSLDGQASKKKPKKMFNFIFSLKPDKLDNPVEKLAGLTRFLTTKESQKVFESKVEKHVKGNGSVKVTVVDQQSASSLEDAIKESDVLNVYKYYKY